MLTHRHIGDKRKVTYFVLVSVVERVLPNERAWQNHLESNALSLMFASSIYSLLLKRPLLEAASIWMGGINNTDEKRAISRTDGHF